MVKNSINDEWKYYIKRQLLKGVSKQKLEEILKKQNYSSCIINKLLHSNEKEDNLIGNKKNTNYNDYIINKIDKLELTTIEKSIIKFMKSQSFLKERIINERIIIIDNWMEGYIANYIYNIFINSDYKQIKTSNQNKRSYNS